MLEGDLSRLSNASVILSMQLVLYTRTKLGMDTISVQ